MKKYRLLILSLLALSCNDMLEETPRDFVSRVNYYQTESDAIGAINGLYYSLSPDYFGSIHCYLLEELHGDYLNGQGGQAAISNFSQVLNTSGITFASTNWTQAYAAINRANAVLDNVKNIQMSESLKAQILSEAMFIRSLAYFDLVRKFGPVPLRLNEVTDMNQIHAPRESVDNVLDQIVADLLVAENNLPEVGESTGRASKWAAKMLLAHIYLTREEWAAAAEKADEVIQSGVYQLVRVEKPDDFYRIFASTFSPEDIMSVHHSQNIQTSVPTFIHRADAFPYNAGAGFSAWAPAKNSWIGDSWSNADLRKRFNFYTKYVNAKGDSIALPATSPILFKKFIDDPNGLSSYTLPIYRFAEALLFYAEASCMAEGAPSALALERLNMVLRRAYGYDPNAVSSIDFPPGMSQEEFRDAVIQERGYEFILERRRWFDLKRTGKLKEAFAQVGKEYIDERILWPIPVDEINNNNAIAVSDQNLGY